MLQHALRKLNLQCAMSHFYAVARGHQKGIYDTWAKCEQQVKGFKGARYRKFPTRAEAETFIKENQCIGGVDSAGGHVAKASAAPFVPKDYAIALGSKKQLDKPPAVDKAEKSPPADQSKSLVETEDYWPASDGDSFDESEFTDAELLAAATAIETSMTAQHATTSTTTTSSNDTRKRKANNDGYEVTKKKSLKAMKHQSKVWQPVGSKRIGGHEFSIDEEGYVIVYTDGSCLNNGQKNACAGFGVYFGDEHALNASNAVTGRVTNNVGEIQASIHAIKVANDVGIPKLCISTDSQFLINAVTCWISSWKRNKWKLKDGSDVKNVVDFKELDALLQDRTGVLVKWNYVKAHKGIKGNEMADRLARAGSDKHRLMQKQLK